VCVLLLGSVLLAMFGDEMVMDQRAHDMCECRGGRAVLGAL
jgi:hypothetical protein